MRNIIVFDDDIMLWLKRELKEYKPRVQREDTHFQVAMRYWIKVYDWTRKEKVFLRYMWNKKRRIQKKWDKKYNDKFRTISKSNFPFIHATV